MGIDTRQNRSGSGDAAGAAALRILHQARGANRGPYGACTATAGRWRPRKTAPWCFRCGRTANLRKYARITSGPATSRSRSARRAGRRAAAPAGAGRHGAGRVYTPGARDVMPSAGLLRIDLDDELKSLKRKPMNALPHGGLALSSLEEQVLQPGVPRLADHGAAAPGRDRRAGLECAARRHQLPGGSLKTSACATTWTGCAPSASATRRRWRRTARPP
jgi:hypothetical protein